MSDDLSPQSYLVWYDPFFEEWFACPEAEVTRTVLSCLSQIHVVPKKIEAASAHEALDAVRPKPHASSSAGHDDDDIPLHVMPVSVRRTH